MHYAHETDENTDQLLTLLAQYHVSCHECSLPVCQYSMEKMFIKLK